MFNVLIETSPKKLQCVYACLLQSFVVNPVSGFKYQVTWLLRILCCVSNLCVHGFVIGLGSSMSVIPCNSILFRCCSLALFAFCLLGKQYMSTTSTINTRNNDSEQWVCICVWWRATT